MGSTSHLHLFFGVSNREWILDGAAVRISMVGFSKDASAATLDGRPVDAINADLTAGADCTEAKPLPANAGQAFQGAINSGAFDIPDKTAQDFLASPSPHGRPASDVIRPWLNGNAITKRDGRQWIIDFGIGMAEGDAAKYEAPFGYLQAEIRPQRDKTKYAPSSKYPFWQLWNPRQEMRAALAPLERYIVTARVSKHRTFVFVDQVVFPDARLVAIASDRDDVFGVLHSRCHELWAISNASRHGIGNDPTYNSTTCYQTFPFPDPTAAQRDAIADAAKELDTLRTNWLNPPEWTRQEVLTFPGSVDGPWSRYVTAPNAQGIGTVRYPRMVPADDNAAKKLAKRTLTNIYNERPTWLDLAHKRLDEAVFAAYGWPPSLTDDELLARLLALNLERAAAE